MQPYTFEKDKTSQSIYFTVQKESDGKPLTGLLYNTAGLAAYYKRGTTGTLTAITLVTLASATAAWSSGGFILVSDTLARAVYRLDVPDAVIAAGEDIVFITLDGVTDMYPVFVKIDLLDKLNVNAGVIEANPVQIGGDAQSLADLKDFADTGYDPATNKVKGVSPELLQNTTIATLASQISFTLTAGSANDNAYNGARIIVTDAVTSTQKATALISNYIGATKTITLSADPAIFTMAAGDLVDIVAANNNAPTVAAIRSEIDANSTQLAAILADTNELQSDDIPTLLSTIASYIDTEIGTLITDLAAVNTTTDGIQTDLSNPTDGLGALKALIDAVKTVTDAIPNSGALTSLIAHLTDIKGTTFNGATDSLESIRNQVGSSGSASSPQVLQSTVIETLASQTSFTLVAGSPDDDAYNKAIIIITDETTSEQKAVGHILDYDGATRTVTLREDPAIFTMAIGDTVNILATVDNLTEVNAVKAKTDQLAFSKTNELDANVRSINDESIVGDGSATKFTV